MATKSKAISRRSRRPGEAVPLTAQAYRAVKEDILSNRLAPGQPVPVERFVSQLGLSRTPIREAILQLAKEGFIEIRPRMGTFVSHLNLRQIQELYEVRSVLEGRAARLAARNADRRQLQEVERQLRAQRTEGPDIDLAAISEAGQQLHRLIVHSAGNQTLEGMILSLYDHFTRFRRLSLQIPEKILSSHQEHLGILEALIAGDGELAERRVHEHFDHAARYLLDSLLGSSRAASVVIA